LAAFQASDQEARQRDYSAVQGSAKKALTHGGAPGQQGKAKQQHRTSTAHK